MRSWKKWKNQNYGDDLQAAYPGGLTGRLQLSPAGLFYASLQGGRYNGGPKGGTSSAHADVLLARHTRRRRIRNETGTGRGLQSAAAYAVVPASVRYEKRRQPAHGNTSWEECLLLLPAPSLRAAREFQLYGCEQDLPVGGLQSGLGGSADL